MSTDRWRECGQRGSALALELKSARPGRDVMARDWAAVADAMKARLADLDMTQAELVQRSRLAPMTIRELLYNSAQRRRSDRTLAALSQALGWPPGDRKSTRLNSSHPSI